MGMGDLLLVSVGAGPRGHGELGNPMGGRSEASRRGPREPVGRDGRRMRVVDPRRLVPGDGTTALRPVALGIGPARDGLRGSVAATAGRVVAMMGSPVPIRAR